MGCPEVAEVLKAVVAGADGLSPTELAGVLKEAVLAGVGVASVTVAMFGLSTWNRQLRGQADFDTARALAKATYQLREELWVCRAPTFRFSEFPGGQPPKGLVNPAAADAYSHVYRGRWNQLLPSLQQFDTSVLEAEAMWGKEVRSRSQVLRECTNELRGAMEQYVENLAFGEQLFRLDSDVAKQLQQALHANRTDQGNPFTLKIQAAIDGIEDVLRAHLKRR